MGRLYQALIKRLNIAKKLSRAASFEGNTMKSWIVEPLLQSSKHCSKKIASETEADLRYKSFLSLLYSLVDGGCNGSSSHGTHVSVDGERYEDRVRSLLGHGAYELVTMDKLISHLLKNLQSMGNDEILGNLIQLYLRHKDSSGFKPSAFKQEASQLSLGENMFAFQYCSLSKVDKSIMFIEYLGCIAEMDKEKSYEEGENDHH